MLAAYYFVTSRKLLAWQGALGTNIAIDHLGNEMASALDISFMYLM